MKAAIMGAGLIGTELYNSLRSEGWDIPCVVRSDGVYPDLSKDAPLSGDYLMNCKDADIAFLAIPTLDDGSIAYNYIDALVDAGIPAVTCEKGALSNYFSGLEGKLDRIGYSATVGGGTRMLHYLRGRSNYIEEAHAVVNGTLNYIFDEVSQGRSFGEVVDETIKLGYAEPGSSSPLDVVNKEATDDVPMKTAILCNIGFGTSLSARDMDRKKMTDADLRSAINESRRYIVSITREDRDEDVIGGFTCESGEFFISAGFKRIENPFYRRLVPSGVDNSLLISEGKYGKDGIYMVSGQGAGVGPTTSAMRTDAKHLLGM